MPKDLDVIVHLYKYARAIWFMRTMKLLFIEDDPSLAEVFKAWYADSRLYNVLVLDTGEEAIEQHRRFKFDLAVVDYQLAGNLNGIDTAVRLLQINPIKLVFCSNLYSEADFQSVMLVQPLMILMKPLDKNVLMDAIEKERKSMFGLPNGKGERGQVSLS